MRRLPDKETVFLWSTKRTLHGQEDGREGFHHDTDGTIAPISCTRLNFQVTRYSTRPCPVEYPAGNAKPEA